MKYVVIFIILISCSCNKSKDVAFTYQRALDSMNIPLSAACWIDSADSIIFNPDQTITEKLNGQQITFGIDFKAWHRNDPLYHTSTLIIDLNIKSLVFNLDSIVQFKFYNCVLGTAECATLSNNPTDTTCSYGSVGSHVAALLIFKKH